VNLRQQTATGGRHPATAAGRRLDLENDAVHVPTNDAVGTGRADNLT
jgi:hypothetical protein